MQNFEIEPLTMCYHAEVMNRYSDAWNTAKHEASLQGLKIIEHGWEQHVIIDETNSVVYRYPRHESAANKLADEVSVLGELSKIDWSVQIPRIIEYTEDFTAYQYIDGGVLNHANLAHLHHDDFEQIGAQLGTFLATLHNAPKEVVSQKTTKQTMSLFEYYQKRIDANPSSIHYQRSKQDLDSLAEATGNSGPEVVVHGDLHGLNMVVDMDKRELKGVIDFSELEIGSSEQDFRKIFMADDRLLEPAVQAFGNASGQDLDVDTIKLWAYVNEWANLCHFSAQPGNETYKRAEMHLRRWGQI